MRARSSQPFDVYWTQQNKPKKLTKHAKHKFSIETLRNYYHKVSYTIYENQLLLCISSYKFVLYEIYRPIYWSGIYY